MKEKRPLVKRETLKKAVPTLMGYVERREKAAQNQLPKHLRPLSAGPVYIQLALNTAIVFTLCWLMMNRDEFMTEAAPALGLVICLLFLIYSLITALKMKHRYRSSPLRRWTVINVWLMWLAALLFPASVAFFLP